VAEADLKMFSNLDEFMREKDVNQQVGRQLAGGSYCSTASFCRYFPKKEDPRHGNMWIINPFVANIGNNNSNMNEKESLIDLSSDSTLKFKFQSTLSKSRFWLSVISKYPFLIEKAMKVVIQFSTTYLCEETFSSDTVI